MKTAGLILLAVLALLAGGFAGGYTWAVKHQTDELSTAKGDTAACTFQLSTTQQTVDSLGKESSDRLDQLKTMRAAATIALDQRDAARDQLLQQTRAREHGTQKVAHETPDCQSLAVVPVCPAVADRLWGQATGQVSGGDTPAAY